MPDSSRAVVDANITICAVVMTGQTRLAFALLERLRDEKVSLYAPRLWVYEVTSGIHKYLHTGLIQSDIAERAMSAVFELGVRLLEETPGLCSSAIRWASRLGQLAAYDGFYLAAAEQLDATFWTADRRLAAMARQAGVGWVHWLGELE